MPARAGAITSRYYGLTERLLGQYAWYQGNSKDRAWPAEACCPTTWACLTCWGTRMNGARNRTAKRARTVFSLDMNMLTKDPRLLRGGAFIYRPAGVRSANRDWNAPSARNTNVGFRPARTYH